MSIPKMLFGIALSACVWILAQSSLGATIPAGTTLAVRTNDALNSHTAVGKTFSGQLDQAVAVSGKTVLAAGTKVTGKVIASRRSGAKSSTSPLTVDLTGLSVNGRTVAVKTQGGVQLEGGPRTARQARAGVTAGETNFRPGTKLEFRLAQPVTF